MTRTHNMETQLRSLDAAHTSTPIGQRAHQDLQRILACDLHPAADLQVRPSWRTAMPGRRKLATAGGLVMAATAGLTVLPSAVGGDQAFATWARTPASLTTQQQADAVTSCRAEQRGNGGGAGELDGARPAVAERRGTWTTVVLAGQRGFSALCVTDSSAGFFTHDMIGSYGTTPRAVAPGPRDVVATDLGTGTMRAGDISLAAGVIGTDVTGVTYRSPIHGDVVATVNGGRFALWMPGAELMDASRAGVPVNVTYHDGTTGTTVLHL